MKPTNEAMLPKEKEKLAAAAVAFPGGGITAENIPGGLSIASFTWIYPGSGYKMEFVAGFVGIERNDAMLATFTGL